MFYISSKMQFVFGLLLAVATVISTERTHHIEKRSERCILPPYPKQGSYDVAGDPAAKPGDDFEAAFLNVTCLQGYGVIGNNVVICANGEWSIKMPQCVPMCYLPKKPSVVYRCLSPGAEEYRDCNDYEPIGSTAKPQCQTGYYHTTPLPRMQCVDGVWNHEAIICTKECGRIQEGETALPWHAIIYKKDKIGYNPVCGGTIISNTIIVTAAHCFWNTVTLKISTSKHKVGVGKTQLGWDENGQTFTVSGVKIPVHFQGAASNYQTDIALVTLSTPIEYSAKVQPVCVDFDHYFETRQLQPGNIGKVTVRFTPDSHAMAQVLEVPYMSIEQCIAKTPRDFREYITADKFCAGYENGTMMCRGSSGAGLAFPEVERGVVHYYLRGVVSTAPHTDQTSTSCLLDIIAFTQVSKHEHFIKEYFV